MDIEQYAKIGPQYYKDEASPLLLAYLGKNEYKTFLDCGCGDVPYYDVYRDQVLDTVCVDWESTLHKNNFVDKYINLNRPIPFENNSFDTILATDVLEHLFEPRQFIKECSRILRPGGKLLVMVPFYYWVHEAPHDYFRYSEYSLRGFCDENRLIVVHLDPYGGYLDIMLDLINKRYIKKEWSVKMFMKIASRFHRTAYYKKVLAESKRTFPLGYCLVAMKSES